MLFPDRFDPHVRFEHVLFTFALGLAFGVLAAGLILLAARRGRRNGLALSAAGLFLGTMAGLLALDASPLQAITFRMKPFFGDLVEAGALALGGLAGAMLTAVMTLLAVRRAPRWGLAIAGVLAALAVGASLFALDSYTTRARPRHPSGTDTSGQVAARRVIEGLEIPTGLAVASNGDIAVLELESANLLLFARANSGFEQRLKVRLPIPEGRLGLHLAFHPDYPAQPYVYLTAENEEPSGRVMHLLRGRIDGNAVTFETLIRSLPAAKLEDRGDHFGSAITFCEGSLFLTTGDTEPGGLHHLPVGEPGVIRHNALQLNSPIGKILRYELDGVDLKPAGVADAPYPVYAFGFRNPFGVTCDEGSGYPVVAENGPEGHDQLRIAPPGTNHEWPLSQTRDLFVRPLLDSGRSRIAPTGAAYRTASGGGHEFLLSAFNSQAIYALPFDSEGRQGKLRLLREVEGGAFNVATDPAGCVYFTDAVSLWQLDDGRCK